MACRGQEVGRSGGGICASRGVVERWNSVPEDAECWSCGELEYQPCRLRIALWAGCRSETRALSLIRSLSLPNGPNGPNGRREGTQDQPLPRARAPAWHALESGRWEKIRIGRMGLLELRQASQEDHSGKTIGEGRAGLWRGGFAGERGSARASVWTRDWGRKRVWQRIYERQRMEESIRNGA